MGFWCMNGIDFLEWMVDATTDTKATYWNVGLTEIYLKCLKKPRRRRECKEGC